jgi:hypothetical protein
MRWIALITTLLLAGCVSTRQYPAPPATSTTKFVENGQNNMLQYEPNDFRMTPIPRNVLVLSGGGMNGAYSGSRRCGKPGEAIGNRRRFS